MTAELLWYYDNAYSKTVSLSCGDYSFNNFNAPSWSAASVLQIDHSCVCLSGNGQSLYQMQCSANQLQHIEYHTKFYLHISHRHCHSSGHHCTSQLVRAMKMRVPSCALRWRSRGEGMSILWDATHLLIWVVLRPLAGHQYAPGILMYRCNTVDSGIPLVTFTSFLLSICPSYSKRIAYLISCECLFTNLHVTTPHVMSSHHIPLTTNPIQSI